MELYQYVFLYILVWLILMYPFGIGAYIVVGLIHLLCFAIIGMIDKITEL